MLVKEVIDIDKARSSKKYQTDTIGGTVVSHPTEPRMRDKLKRLGSGVEATTFQHKTKGDTIIKVIDNIDPNDSYFSFLRMILNHQDNPFFPRIYSAKIYKQDKGKVALVIQMEKLRPLHHSRIKHAIPHILKQLGLAHTFYDEDFEKKGEDILGDVYDYVGKLEDDFYTPTAREELRAESKNPKFVEAMTLLEPLFKKHGADVHGKNMLVRITSIGPQLVIIDPLMPFMY